MNAHASKGLGKGLSALMGEDYSHSGSQEAAGAVTNVPGGEGLHHLPIESIHSGAFQPRTRFDETYLHELADSIEKNGVMQPIIVRPSQEKRGQYEIIAGERRWRACKLARITTIPAIVREINNQLALELALVENIQRQDLSVLEEASGYQRLIEEFGYTQEELARTVGKSRSHIANLLRLLELPETIKQHLESESLSMGHARALLNSPDAEKFADLIVKQGLNVRQAEQLVRDGTLDKQKPPEITPGQSGAHNHNGVRPSSPARRPIREKDPDIIALEQTLSDNLGLSVSINDYGNQSGDIVIQYQSLSGLDEILRRLGGGI